MLALEANIVQVVVQHVAAEFTMLMVHVAWGCWRPANSRLSVAVVWLCGAVRSRHVGAIRAYLTL